MKVLQTAIVSKFGSSTTLTNSVGGRLYFDHGPQNAVYPYIVFSVLTNFYNYDFTPVTWEDILVQFNIYSQNPSSSEAGDIFEYLKSAFDFCVLSVSGFNFIKMERVFSTVDWFDEEGVWGYTVRYRVLLNKTS